MSLSIATRSSCSRSCRWWRSWPSGSSCSRPSARRRQRPRRTWPSSRSASTSRAAQVSAAHSRPDRLRSRLRRDRPPRQGDPRAGRHAEPARAARGRGRGHRHPLHEDLHRRPQHRAGRPPPRRRQPPGRAGHHPVEAGGEPAQAGPARLRRRRTPPPATSDQRSAAAEQSGVDAADAQTSTPSGQGLPIGAVRRGAPGAAAASPTGLETVPLELEFVGDFFNLADFFHDVKRFVRVAGSNVIVGGRLITIESVSYSSDRRSSRGSRPS